MYHNINNNIMVSVIMITYGHEKYIKQAIEGVLMQKCNFNVELIVANDCSPDTTNSIIHEIIEKHSNGSWVNFINREKNIGGQNNFDDAFNRCKGKYIAHCEGDDYWTDSNKLQKQIDFLEANPDYVLTFHKVKILKPNGDLVDDFITKVPDNYETQETLARLGNYIHTPTVVFRNIIHNLPYELTISPIGDYFLYMILSQQGKLKYFEREMAVYRYGVGIHSTQNQIKMAKANFKLFTLLLSYFNDPKINRILLERQLGALDNFENLIRSEYSDSFVSNNVFFKAIKALKKPSKFWNKLKAKFQ
jgi:glycosyltransferase involved in cell wall biosynthesis